MTKENHEKTTVRLVGTGIRTRDLPNASLVRYNGATSLGVFNIVSVAMLLNQQINRQKTIIVSNLKSTLIEINLSQMRTLGIKREKV